MFKIISKEIEWAGSKLKIETGKFARQADGAVMVSYGETMVLCTVVSEKKPKEDIDFLPLTVHYKEMFFASGRIPGGFFKREGKPSEKEVLVSRLIDRPIRPLFPDYYHHETQVICTVMSYDNIHDSDVIAIIGTAAALAISKIPFAGPLAAAKVGYKNGEFILNPKNGKDLQESELDLVVAGTDDSVLMVESEANILSEEIMLGAVEFGHQSIKPVIDMINKLAAEVSPTKMQVQTKDTSAVDRDLSTAVEEELRNIYTIIDKQQRSNNLDGLKKKAEEALISTYSALEIHSAFKRLQQNIVRRQIVDLGKRIDSRKIDEIRQIECEVSFLPRVHGSALFTRGETQVVVGTTLGAASDEQMIDGLEGESKQRFMLHYNFPPYSVGEATPFRAPGRREIGHGKLAWRAVNPVLPLKEAFPYALRVVSEVTESNGSSSMATVCGAILSLMDAGVPIKAPVAGIAMGLILEKDKHVVLSDILGDEDYLGDMDFKVAGTENGITALQMDIKVKGINYEIMKTALSQAKAGRLHILGKMISAISSPRTTLNEFAPSILTIKINKDKIREIIGPGGKTIKAICEATKAKVDIDDNGTVTISSLGIENGLQAQKMVEEIALDPQVNNIYHGKVVKLMDFGAFVNISNGKDGFLHISEVTNDRETHINSVLKEEDKIWVKVIGFDQRGKIKLSMKIVDQNTGESLLTVESEQPTRESKTNSTNGNKGGKSFNKKSSNHDKSSDFGNKKSDRPDRTDRTEKSDKRKYFG